MATTGIVNKILRHSFVDGPGNRAVIFLQGCTYNCLYCHNPYTINFCIHCGDCVPTCPSGALQIQGGEVVWQLALCTECDTCIEVCPHGSSPRTRKLSARQVWEEEIKPVQGYISGVTVSGGEPTVQMDFLVELFSVIKEESDLTTLIETNGDFNPVLLEALGPVLDLAMVDLKAWDTGLHRKLTGQDHDLTRKNIRLLAQSGKLHAVRQVIVPGFTDALANMAATARFLAEIDPTIQLRLLRFRPHGVPGEARDWLSPEDDLMDRLVEAAKAQGLTDVDRSL